MARIPDGVCVRRHDDKGPRGIPDNVSLAPHRSDRVGKMMIATLIFLFSGVCDPAESWEPSSRFPFSTPSAADPRMALEALSSHRRGFFSISVGFPITTTPPDGAGSWQVKALQPGESRPPSVARAIQNPRWDFLATTISGSQASLRRLRGQRRFIRKTTGLTDQRCTGGATWETRRRVRHDGDAPFVSSRGLVVELPMNLSLWLQDDGITMAVTQQWESEAPSGRTPRGVP